MYIVLCTYLLYDKLLQSGILKFAPHAVQYRATLDLDLAFKYVTVNIPMHLHA
jgi:hypothetical protein